MEKVIKQSATNIRSRSVDTDVSQGETGYDAELAERQRIRSLQTRSRQADNECFTHARIALVKFDRHGVIRSMNDAAVALLREERSTLVGTSFAERLSPDDAASFANHLHECGATGIGKTVVVCVPMCNEQSLRLRLVSSAEQQGGDKNSLLLSALSDLTSLMTVQENAEILNSFFTDHVHELEQANVALRLAM